jgi:glycosyltransferase involved in cell wall biosynthesis
MGGDTLQVEYIARELNKLHKMDVVIQNWSTNWSSEDYDLIHIFNNRPLFLSKVLSKLKNSNAPIIISPIHHSFDEMYRVRVESWPNTLVKKILRKFRNRPALKRWAVHYSGLTADLFMQQRHKSWGLLIMHILLHPKDMITQKKIRKIYSSLNNFIFLAEGERKSLENDYQIKVRNFHIVPNGLPSLVEINEKKLAFPPINILVIGRIEPRKRQLEIAQSAKSNSISVTFVGALSPTQAEYGETFLSYIKDSHNLNYLGPLPHLEVLELILSCNALFSASLAEVLSLVELEAIALGTRVVSAGAGYTNEYATPEQIILYPWEEINFGLQVANQSSQNTDRKTKCFKISSWTEIAHLHQKIYETLAVNV